MVPGSGRNWIAVSAVQQSRLNKNLKTKDMTTLHLRKSINRSPLRRGFPVVLLALALALFAPSRTAQAQLPSPSPDGGYPNFNTAEGDGALSSVTTGANNTANGFDALNSTTTGSANTATGVAALVSNTTGGANTANGVNALHTNNAGNNNTATGVEALFSNTTGGANTATGVDALVSNTTGNNNTATGVNALLSNTTGLENTANGVSALFSNQDGSDNTANGVSALFSNTTGSDNTANGYHALFSNQDGGSNTATGFAALFNNTTGNANTATGIQALVFNTTGGSNTANGVAALFFNTTGGNNIALGSNAGFNLTTGSNNIDIGNQGVSGESNTIRIGTGGTQTNAYMAGIYNATVAKGLTVVVDSTGHLGTKGSSERFKDAIKPMDKTSEAILALKPVTFHYKKELDPEGIPQFGLVAEQVEKVNPDLVARDADGKVYTVRYDAVNAMLLNEFLKEHRKVEQQETTITQLKATVAQQQKGMEVLTAGLKEQASQIQKVSAQVELNKPSPQVAVNNP